MIKFKRLLPHAIIPSQANPGDAGFDLFSLVDFDFINSGETIIARTGVACEIPEGFVGMVCPRSGLAAKQGITVVNAPGIIDSSYRGEIKVILTRLGDHDDIYTVSAGDRIAQLVIVPCLTSWVETQNDLTPTLRGSAGLGSTGV